MLTGRGLAAAAVSFLVVILLLLCLTETRRIGQWRSWGLYYYSRHGNMAQFGFWFPLLLTCAGTVPFAYFFGNRLYTPGAWKGGLVGAAIGVALFLIPISLGSRDHPTANRNHQLMGAVMGLCMGAGLGAECAGRLLDARRRRFDED